MKSPTFIALILLFSTLNFPPLLGFTITSEHFSEELSIRALPNRDVLTSFNFTIGAESEDDSKDYRYRFLPSLLHQLMRAQGAERLELALTGGFWRPILWGHYPAHPTGASLLVRYSDGLSEEKVEERWDSLVHLLNGVLCSSLLAINPQMTTAPRYFPSGLSRSTASVATTGNTRYGRLSGESICSENLWPWKKLLPCKQSGLVALLEPRHWFSARFRSLSVCVERQQMGSGGAKWLVQLRADAVQSVELSEELSLERLFAGRSLFGQCRVADSSTVRVEPSAYLLYRNGSTPSSPYTLNLKSIDWGEEAIALLPPMKLRGDGGGEHWPPFNGDSPHLTLHTYVESGSQVAGRICTRITNPHHQALESALYTHLVPWQIRVYLHTLQMRCRRLAGRGEWKEFNPQRRYFQLAKDRKRPLWIELLITVPASAECMMEMDYETAFLRIGDYPADASSGIHVPGPTLTFQPPAVIEQHTPGNTSVHGEPLLILLPVPDFSMPFNVICLVCTAIAIFYGNVFAVTTKIMRPISEKDSLGGKGPLSTLLGGVMERLRAIRDRLRRKTEKEKDGAKND